MECKLNFSLEAAHKITQKLADHNLGFFFKDPIPKDSKIYKDYMKLIKEPMYFCNVLEKLESGEYKNTVQWYNDISKVFKNVKKFFGTNSCFTDAAIELEKCLHKLMLKENVVSTFGFVEYAQKLFHKIDDCLRNPPSGYDFEGKPLTPGLEKNDLINFAVASSMLTGKNDVLAIGQILKLNGMEIEPKEEFPSIDLNKLSDQCLVELITFVKQRYANMGIPYPRKEILKCINHKKENSKKK